MALFDIPAPAWYLVVLVALGHALGSFAIGVVGLGGVVYAPLLLLLAGIDVDTALICAFAAPIIGMLAKFHVLHARGALYWQRSAEFCLLVVPGAALGSTFMTVLPLDAIRCGLALLCFCSAAQTAVHLSRARTAAPPGAPGDDVALQTPSEPTDAAAPDGAASDGLADGRSLVHENRPLLDDAWGWTVWRVGLGLFISAVSAVSGAGGPILTYPLVQFLAPRAAMSVMVPVVHPFAFVNVVVNLAFALARHPAPDAGIVLAVVAHATLWNVVGAQCSVLVSEVVLRVMVVVLMLTTGAVTLGKVLA